MGVLLQKHLLYLCNALYQITVRVDTMALPRWYMRSTDFRKDDTAYAAPRSTAHQCPRSPQLSHFARYQAVAMSQVCSVVTLLWDLSRCVGRLLDSYSGICLSKSMTDVGRCMRCMLACVLQAWAIGGRRKQHGDTVSPSRGRRIRAKSTTRSYRMILQKAE